MALTAEEIAGILKAEADHECEGFGERKICVKIAAIADLPSRFGRFQVAGFWNNRDGKDHVAIMHGNPIGREDVPTRVHSECLTGDALGSLRCDCRDQLEVALRAIAGHERGLVLYLRQEGRGIGLATLSQLCEAGRFSMLVLTAERADLANGQRILELGCGWGSLSLWMAARFPSATIVAVSNSAAQRRFIEDRATARGLANLRVLTADINDFAPEGSFDRVVSVEMFEHVRNWAALLDRVADWLAPVGRLFLHVFCHRDLAYFFETDGRSDWMARHFFTGGLMPSDDLALVCASRLRVEAQWSVEGAHYARTCRAWLARQDAARLQLMSLFERTYGPREAARWFARWRMFFLACAELFDYAGSTEWCVTHVRLARAEAA